VRVCEGRLAEVVERMPRELVGISDGLGVRVSVCDFYIWTILEDVSSRV